MELTRRPDSFRFRWVLIYGSVRRMTQFNEFRTWLYLQTGSISGEFRFMVQHEDYFSFRWAQIRGSVYSPTQFQVTSDMWFGVTRFQVISGTWLGLQTHSILGDFRCIVQFEDWTVLSEFKYVVLFTVRKHFRWVQVCGSVWRATISAYFRYVPRFVVRLDYRWI